MLLGVVLSSYALQRFGDPDDMDLPAPGPWIAEWNSKCRRRHRNGHRVDHDLRHTTARRSGHFRFSSYCSAPSIGRSHGSRRLIQTS
jgi:hypothetical protein